MQEFYRRRKAVAEVPTAGWGVPVSRCRLEGARGACGIVGRPPS